jgi:protoporphyrinogen oxidase
MIVIIGGGLAGLSTALHLGDTPHVVLEADQEPGGLCRSRDINGFVFDVTGHLLHLRDPRAEALIQELLPDTFVSIERKAAIRTRGVTLPFPYQANLHGLPPEFVARCITGFVESLDREIPDDPAASFQEWALAVFGERICEGFMFPYNRKLFCREPGRMTADWVSWAVPRPNLEEVVRGAVGVQNTGMGYNSSFLYPSRGGIGVLPAALASRMTSLRCNSAVAAVDLDSRSVTLKDGETIGYEHLVVTAPLPAFLDMLGADQERFRQYRPKLDASVVACLNLGVDRSGLGGGEHWLYFPDDDVPFYRVGFPSAFSDGVAPPGTSSMYVEIGLSADDPWEPDQLVTAAEEGLRKAGILESGDRILARDLIRVDPGYVIFDQARQEAMADLLPALEGLGVHLIGRYGAWTYSYMERALLDGLETAEKILS